MLSPFEWWCRNFILPDICKPCLFVFLRNLFYLTETKSAIEQVIDVFNDYIRTSTHFELLWSDKVGYIYISIDNVQGSIGDTGCCVVNCGEELFDKLVWELAVDIMEEVGHTIDPTEATLLERREIERRIHPYLEQLPTYQDRLQRVFTREKD